MLMCLPPPVVEGVRFGRRRDVWGACHGICPQEQLFSPQNSTRKIRNICLTKPSISSGEVIKFIYFLANLTQTPSWFNQRFLNNKLKVKMPNLSKSYQLMKKLRFDLYSFFGNKCFHLNHQKKLFFESLFLVSW